MAIPATQMRPGMIIKHNNELHAVFSVEHRTPGNLRAFIQAKLRNLRTGAMFEHRFRSPDPIDRVIVDEVPMEFLYADGDDYYFMNTENFEQTHLKRDTLGDSVEYLIPNLQIRVSFFDGVAVGIELPQTVEMTVVQTEPGLKSATASWPPSNLCFRDTNDKSDEPSPTAKVVEATSGRSQILIGSKALQRCLLPCGVCRGMWIESRYCQNDC
jgi:elongation factor P